MSNIVILLTACINPNGMSFTAIQDKDVRLKQYKEALNWYIENTTVKIVFVENSNSDLSPFYKKYIEVNRLEILTFDGNNYDKTRGKGYGESLIIEYALKNSSILNRNCNIVKITGRLICGNINRILRNYIDNQVVYGIKSLDDFGNLRINSQVIVAPYIFFKDFFLPLKEKVNDRNHIWFEHVLLYSVNDWIEGGNQFKEMWMPLYIRGISGTSGESAGSKLLNNKLIFYVHYILRRLGYYGPVRFWLR